MDWKALDWDGVGLDWIGWDWSGLGRVGLHWIRLGWIGPPGFGLDRIGSNWMDLGRQVGRLVGLKNRWKIARNRFGCFHIALGTLQEALEHERQDFGWFCNFFGGGRPMPRHARARDCPTP